MTQDPTARYMPAKDAASILGVSTRQVLRWAATRELACVRLGPKCVRFRLADVEAFATKRRVAALRGS